MNIKFSVVFSAIFHSSNAISMKIYNISKRSSSSSLDKDFEFCKFFNRAGAPTTGRGAGFAFFFGDAATDLEDFGFAFGFAFAGHFLVGDPGKSKAVL